MANEISTLYIDSVSLNEVGVTGSLAVTGSVSVTGSLIVSASGLGYTIIHDNVGIGEFGTSPPNKLSVNGSGSDVEAIRIGNTTGGDGGLIGKTYLGFHCWSTNGANRIYSPVLLGVEETGISSYDTNFVIKIRNSNTGSGVSGSDIAPVTRITLTPTGSIIISGSISASDGFTGSLLGTATTASYFNGSVTNAISASYALGYVKGSGTLNRYAKFNAGSSIANALLYDDGNYVGLYETSPLAIFDVGSGDYTTQGTVRIGADAGTSTRSLESNRQGVITGYPVTSSVQSYALLSYDALNGGVNTNATLRLGAASGSSYNSVGSIKFYTTQFDVDVVNTGSMKMYIEPSGNVGIGIDEGVAPATKIHVSGAAGTIARFEGPASATPNRILLKGGLVFAYMSLSQSLALGFSTTHNSNILFVTNSGVNIVGSVSASNGFTGSLLGTAATASFFSGTVVSSSYASSSTTASYVLNAISASNTDLLDNRNSTTFANTGSNTFVGNQLITGSLTASGSSHVFIGAVTASNISASNGFTGSLLGTATTASYILNAITASYVLQAVSSSFATLAQTANTASYVITAQTASFFSGTVISSSYASSSTSASYTLSSSFALSSVLAISGNSIYSALSPVSTSNFSPVSGVFVGINAGVNADRAINSIFIGAGAGNNFLMPTISLASHSVFIGTNAGNGATYAENSIFLGQAAGGTQPSASFSTFIGYYAGWRSILDTAFDRLLGPNNIIIGKYISLPKNYSNYVNIGAALFISGTYSDATINNPFTSSATSKIGINKVAPDVTLDVVGGVSASNGFTGSLLGTVATASYVLNAVTASYVLQAVSASFATLAQTANTASYVLNAVSASYASSSTSASYALSASWAPGATATTPGGSNTHIQFNGGASNFSGSANFTFNSASNNVVLTTGSFTLNGTGSGPFLIVSGAVSSSTLSDWFAQGQVKVRISGSGLFQTRDDVAAFFAFSDERLKTAVRPICGSLALDQIEQLQGVYYQWKEGSRVGKDEIGLIAQQVELVVPEVVRELPRLQENGTSLAYKSVDYEHLTALLIEAVKEQQKQINKQQEQIDILFKNINK